MVEGESPPLFWVKGKTRGEEMRTILFLIAASFMAYGAMTMGDAGSSAINAHVEKMESFE